jgi:hypothetical protein
MVDDITLQKRTLRVLIISALLVTVCLIFLNPDLAIPADPSKYTKKRTPIIQNTKIRLPVKESIYNAE